MCIEEVFVDEMGMCKSESLGMLTEGCENEIKLYVLDRRKQRCYKWETDKEGKEAALLLFEHITQGDSFDIE